MERLLELLGPAVQFVYTCWDRIVLNGYLERLQRPENLVYFFHDIVGVACIEPAVLELRTKMYKAWVRRITDEWGIPVLAAPPKGVRKEDFVQPFYRRLNGAEGIACILTSREQGRTFVSYTPRFSPPSGDPHYRLIKACRKQFLHYYWYRATRSRVITERRYPNFPGHPVDLLPYSHLMCHQIRTGGRVINRLKLR